MRTGSRGDTPSARGGLGDGAVEDLRLDPLIYPELSASIGGSGEFPPLPRDGYRSVTESACTLHGELTHGEKNSSHSNQDLLVDIYER